MLLLQNLLIHFMFMHVIDDVLLPLSIHPIHAKTWTSPLLHSLPKLPRLGKRYPTPSFTTPSASKKSEFGQIISVIIKKKASSTVPLWAGPSALKFQSLLRLSEYNWKKLLAHSTFEPGPNFSQLELHLSWPSASTDSDPNFSSTYCSGLRP